MSTLAGTERGRRYLARIAAIEGGCSEGIPAFNVNRRCGSGLRPVISASQSIVPGDTEIAIGGGAENMSRTPYIAAAARWGARMGDSTMIDMMPGALHDPFHGIHMCVTLEDMMRLKPAFVMENGTVTAGNASGINDAAAALVLMEHIAAEERGTKPLARLVAYAHAGVDPRYMGMGSVPLTRLALQRAGLAVDGLDVIETHEAFAAQACAVTRALGLDPAKVNPNDSEIPLGHPVGATGAVITIKGPARTATDRRPLRAGDDVYR
ncbi:hypothetical protein DR64_7872 [Paraburkholderia xenovorans LB400]|uniref:Acetyl-CoA C-acetyltransferase n=1 Tax=Paraburkholderia xenovorans (strain LB400) TaxID=266265 RepID=Q13HG7_PARXL|nr:Acetyl-CoA C-acetyltransferase [Paraburkholderia xenovorans LB400]AIP34964.1 hypothetical protein DR64_7872 [Paraburkholderia xenovorans LB400]